VARTRAQIKTLVTSRTGKSDSTLMNSLADSALKEAVIAHKFFDSVQQLTDISITEDAVEISLLSPTVGASAVTVKEIIAVLITESNSTRSAPLHLKNRTWFFDHVHDPSANQKGWPLYGWRNLSGSSKQDRISIDRPALPNLTAEIIA